MFDLDTLFHGYGKKPRPNKLEIVDKTCIGNVTSDINEMADVSSIMFNAVMARVNEDNKRIANAKIKAIEAMEAETDPKIKRRMEIYIMDGIYDFSGIRNI